LTHGEFEGAVVVHERFNDGLLRHLLIVLGFCNTLIAHYL
jgi:hypothetical protein